MRTSRRTPILAAFPLFALLLSASVHAAPLPSRVFVSPTGSDSNNCANPTTPCLTFAGAMSQVADAGEIMVLATSGYGPLSITRSVLINAPAGVTAYSCCTVVINAPHATVSLRGITIDGAGKAQNGIQVANVGTLYVDNCLITGFTGPPSTTAGNGLWFGSPGHLFVTNTTVRGNSQIGIMIQPVDPLSGSTQTAHASIDHCHLDGNGTGLLSDINTSTVVRYSFAAGNLYDGFAAQNAGVLNVEDCVATSNGNGIGAYATSAIYVSNTTVTGNNKGLNVAFASLLSRSNNTVENNGTNGSFNFTFAAK